MQGWDRSKAIQFVVLICALNWTLSIGGSFGPQIEFQLPGLQFAVGSKFLLLMGASLVPAIICVISYPECRTSLTMRAPWFAYLIAVPTGLAIPLLSYLGSHYAAFPWGKPVAVTLARVFALNLVLSPLWEEIIWRGCFLKEIRSFCSLSGGTFLASIGWTVWHFGFIAYLYSSGIPLRVLLILPFTYFFSGIMFCALFVLGLETIWPCVLLHAAFNASTEVYYASYGRASELSSYVSELIFMAIAAGVLFWIAARRERISSSANESWKKAWTTLT